MIFSSCLVSEIDVVTFTFGPHSRVQHFVLAGYALCACTLRWDEWSMAKGMQYYGKTSIFFAAR